MKFIKVNLALMDTKNFSEPGHYKKDIEILLNTDLIKTFEPFSSKDQTLIDAVYSNGGFVRLFHSFEEIEWLVNHTIPVKNEKDPN